MSAPGDIWALSHKGLAVDLLGPSVDQVDFEDLVCTMAGVYRWCGAAEPDVSIGLHTLIALEAAPPALRPWVLLHDAHEARLGDWTTPVQRAIAAKSRAMVGMGSDFNVAAVLAALQGEHDAVIHAAAGLALPGEEQRAAIRHADLVALNTERRDFLRGGHLAFGPEIDAIAPLPCAVRWMPKPVVRRKLYAEFLTHLPALARRAA